MFSFSKTLNIFQDKKEIKYTLKLILAKSKKFFDILQKEKKWLVDIRRPTYIFLILFNYILLFEIYSIKYFCKNLNCRAPK